MKRWKYENTTHLDGVHGANVNPGDRHTRKHMPADLECTHRQGCPEYGDRWRAQLAEINGRGHDEEAAEGNKTKLDDGESDWIAKLLEDCFPCV